MTPAVEDVALEVLRQELLPDELLESALPARITTSRVWRELVTEHGSPRAAAAALAAAEPLSGGGIQPRH
jgi:hypothetical protein